MATYAAYRHIELDNIGYGKKRVLKPPGGGSSDIFGASEPVEPLKRNRAQQQSSNIFEAEPAAAAPTQTKPEAAPDQKKAAPVANGSDPPAATPAPASAPASASAASRQRIPPGGFSSGLW